jgi:hypothetical protein
MLCASIISVTVEVAVSRERSMALAAVSCRSFSVRFTELAAVSPAVLIMRVI